MFDPCWCESVNEEDFFPQRFWRHVGMIGRSMWNVKLLWVSLGFRLRIRVETSFCRF